MVVEVQPNSDDGARLSSTSDALGISARSVRLGRRWKSHAAEAGGLGRFPPGFRQKVKNHAAEAGGLGRFPPGFRQKVKNHAAEAGGIAVGRATFRLKLKNHAAEAGGLGRFPPELGTR